jgi:hypothetical protein
MATPGELVRTVAQVLGIPEATVTQHDRNLASAGLRTKGGRGRSAARVTPQDAAHLLIAICGAPLWGATVKESLATCERYSALRAYGAGGRLDNLSRIKSQLPTLGRLPDGHRFVEAISALITSINAGEFEFWGKPTGTVYVGFSGPNPEGSILVSVRRSARLYYRTSPEREFGDKDFRQERRFTIETLREIATVIGNTRPELKET